MTIHIEQSQVQDSLPTILFDNYFAAGTIWANTEDQNYRKENVVDEGTVKLWKPTDLPAIIFSDFGTPKLVDSVAVVSHTLGSTGCTVYVESSDDDIFYVTRATVAPTDDTTLLILFGPVRARYWRLRIIDGTNLPFLGVVIMTKRFNFPAGVKAPYTPAWLARDYELLTANTIGGQFIGNRVLRLGGSTQINLVSVSREFGEEDLVPFMNHYNSGKAFVWASGPSIFDKDVAYAWRKENSTLSPTFDQNGSWMSVGMEVYVYGD